MRILGIDPGASGAVALVEGSRLLWVRDMPVTEVRSGGRAKKRVSPGLLAQIVRADAGGVDHAFIEEVAAMPRQGVSSTFVFGTAYGIALGVLGALTIPYTTITPPTWRRAAQTRGDKDASRGRAAQLFPAAASLFARKKDDGRAEAALIAYAGFLISRGGGDSL